MQMRRQFAVAAVLLALLLCGRARAQQAQVLDQVPADALVVLKVKNLDTTSKKVAKVAKELGLDQFAPDLADPLGAAQEKTQLSKGINKAGDLAIAFVDPASVGGDEEKAVLVLIPVTDFQAFLGNFKNPKAQGDITEATAPEGDHQVFLGKWGTYAAISPGKEVLAKKPAGLKLQGAAAKESDAKDVLLYANIPALKDKALPQLKQFRDQILTEVENNLGAGGENGKKFVPVVKAVVGQYLNMAEEFLNDARSATVGLNLSDAGLSTTVMADFLPDTYLGKLAGEMKSTDGSLITGLPDRKYLAFGGVTMDPKVSARVFGDIVDPIAKELANVPEAKAINSFVDGLRKVMGGTSGWSAGYVVPNGALGQESVLQVVGVSHGDAAAITGGQKQALQSMGDLMKMLPQAPNMSVQFNYTPNAKTVAGVQLDAYESKINLPDDDPQAANVKQMMAFVYGPNGQSGVLGVVDPKTVVFAQGAGDPLVADLIASSKAGTDPVSNLAPVKAVSAQLPAKRSAVFYIAVDNIANTGLRYAKGLGAPVNIKFPANLPPIGASFGPDQTAIRGDAFIPLDLVKALVTAGAEVQKAGNPNGGL